MNSKLNRNSNIELVGTQSQQANRFRNSVQKWMHWDAGTEKENYSEVDEVDNCPGGAGLALESGDNGEPGEQDN